METTRLSSKGQVIIPKSVRSAHRWEAGLDFQIIDTGDGISVTNAAGDVVVKSTVPGSQGTRRMVARSGFMT